MKKATLYFLFLIMLPLAVFSQTGSQSQPKLRYQNGFFNVKWELGQKDVTANEVQLHLDKTDTDASYNFKRARALEKQSAIFTILASAALIAGLSTKDEAAIAGYGTCIVFSSIGLGTSITSKKKYDKAVSIYNRKYGY